MEFRRTRYSFLNFISTAYIMVITSVMPFIIRTLIVRMIGLEYTGVNNLFSSIMSVLNLTELGIESAVSYYLYSSMASKDSLLTGAIIKLFRKVYRIIALVMALAGLLLMPFLTLLVHERAYPYGLNIYIIFFIYLIYTVLPYLTIGYRFILFKADQRSYIYNLYGGTTCFIMYTLQIISICLYKNFYIYTFLMLINPILLCIFLGFRSIKDYPDIKCNGNMSKDFLLGFNKRIFSIILSKMRNISRNTFDSLVISLFLGLTQLAKYQNYYQVMCLPVYAIAIIHLAVGPSFGNSIALETKEHNYKILELYSFIQCSINVICCSCLINLFQPFMRLWMGKQYLLPFEIVVLFTLYYYLLAISDIGVLLREVTGIWWEGRYIAVFEAAFNLLLNIILIEIFDVAGVILATILTLLLINLPFEFYYIFHNYFQGKSRAYLVTQIKYAMCTFLTTVISYSLCKHITVASIPSLILMILASVVIPLGCFLLFFSKNSHIKELFNITKEVYHSFLIGRNDHD